MSKILRKLFFTLSSGVHSIIPSIYEVYYSLATAEFITTDEVENLSRNIYSVISVCMLFAFGIRLLQAIVNPDSFSDPKKGAKGLFIRSIVGLLLIVGIPLAFEFAYDVQGDILEKNLVGKIVFGFDQNSDQELGETLALESFKSFCYLNYEKVNVDSDIEDDYEDALDDLDDMDDLSDVINEKKNGEYQIAFPFSGLLSFIFGIYICYQMVLMVLDIALRTLKLAVLQMMTPLVIVAYIFSGTEILQKWFKEVLSTYLLVFLKIIAILFVFYGIQSLHGFMNNVDIDGFLAKNLARAAIIIGLLTLLKQIPKIIEAVFGIKIESKGGIGDRLKDMAGVGDMASNAWDKLRGGAKALGAAGVGKIGNGIANKLNSYRAGIAGAGKGKSLAEKLKAGYHQNKDRKESIKNQKRAQGLGTRAFNNLKKVGSTYAAGLKAGNKEGWKAGTGQYKTDKIARAQELADARSRATDVAGGLSPTTHSYNGDDALVEVKDKDGKIIKQKIKRAKTDGNGKIQRDSNGKPIMEEVERDKWDTKSAMIANHISAKDNAHKMVDAQNNMSANEKEKTKAYVDEKGTNTELKKISEARENIANELKSMAQSTKDETKAAGLTSLASQVLDKNQNFDINTQLSEELKKLNLGSEFNGSLNTIGGQIAVGLNAQTNLLNSGLLTAEQVKDISGMKGLNGQMVASEARLAGAKADYDAIYKDASDSSKSEMDMVTTKANTAYAQLPGYYSMEAGVGVQGHDLLASFVPEYTQDQIDAMSESERKQYDAAIELETNIKSGLQMNADLVSSVNNNSSSNGGNSDDNNGGDNSGNSSNNNNNNSGGSSSGSGTSNSDNSSTGGNSGSSNGGSNNDGGNQGGSSGGNNSSELPEIDMSSIVQATAEESARQISTNMQDNFDTVNRNIEKSEQNIRSDISNINTNNNE